MRRHAFLSAATACVLTSVASPAPADVATTPLIIGPPTGQDAAGLYYAMQKGWFQQAGLDISVMPAAGATAIPGVLGGALQVAYANVFSLCIAHQKGIAITLIAPGVAYASATAFNQLLVAGDSPIHAKKDFVGKTVAVPSLGESSLAVQEWLRQGGVDGTSVHFVEMKPSAMPAALAAKRIDAIVVYDPYLNAAEVLGARSVGKPYDQIAVNYLDAAWFTTIPYATAHRDAIVKFAAALNRGQQYYDTHYDDLIPLISDFTKLAPDTLHKLMPELIPATLTPTLIQPVIEAAVRYGAITSSFPAKELIFT